MRAITEIPANTPRPMGRTDNFFPGTAKLLAVGVALAPLDEAESAAEVADDPELAAEVAEPVWLLLALDDVAVAEPLPATVDKP